MDNRIQNRQEKEDVQPDRGQVNRSAAQVYDEFFVPALFEQWPVWVIEAAQIQAGQRILDVACGTGILACAAEAKAGPVGSVIGLDINEGMLDVARKKTQKIEWRLGQAETLPFPGESFDAVISQFGLMFFVDPVAAIKEMDRVLRPGGRMAIAVWHSLENTPGYAAMVSLLDRLFGDWAASSLQAPFNLGDRSRLRSLFADADLQDVRITTYPGKARFPSLASWVYTEIKGWTLADRIDDAQLARLLDEAQQVLRSFVQEDGSVVFDVPAHIVTVSK